MVRYKICGRYTVNGFHGVEERWRVSKGGESGKEKKKKWWGREGEEGKDVEDAISYFPPIV